MDDFCFRIAECPDFSECVIAWNVLRALLRTAGNTVETCFLALLTAALVSAVILGLQVFIDTSGEGDGFWAASGLGGCGTSWASYLAPRLAPLVLMLLNAFAVFFKAATVTEKCSRVPALINSFEVGKDAVFDHERMYVVQFIQNSAAGFYVHEVKVSMYMFLKASYFTLFGVAVVLTRTVLK